MKLNIIGLIIIVSILSGCKNRTDDFWFLRKDKNYQRIQSTFQNYIDFFPKNGDANYINNTWSLDYDTQYSIMTVFKFEENQFIETLDSLKKCSIAKYSPEEKCLLVLNRFMTSSNYGYPKEDEINLDIIDLECYNNKYPIPNFSLYKAFNSSETECRLKKNFEIYVLDSKIGEFLAEKKLTKGKYMPEKWKNGYSKGIAVDELRKIIIYWVIIW